MSTSTSVSHPPPIFNTAPRSWSWQDDARASRHLAFPQLDFVRLDQTYRRLDENRYAYTAPMFGYEAVLDVSPIDLVLDYPGLWTSVARPG
ncbi:hypothetical protein MPLA_950014 [Mesorhizobium sp. ORS 3359]|nr:hypothetical protein MPLA_950014 [Mesorhizobium sp. ORS 3359]